MAARPLTADRVTSQVGAAPVQGPVQPQKLELASGAAVRVTTVLAR